MISRTPEFIEAFVEYCAETGFTEKQAAAMLDLVWDKERDMLVKQASPMGLGRSLGLGLLGGAGSYGLGATGALPDSLPTNPAQTGIMGATLGGAGALGYGLIKHRVNPLKAIGSVMPFARKTLAGPGGGKGLVMAPGKVKGIGGLFKSDAVKPVIPGMAIGGGAGFMVGAGAKNHYEDPYQNFAAAVPWYAGGTSSGSVGGAGQGLGGHADPFTMPNGLRQLRGGLSGGVGGGNPLSTMLGNDYNQLRDLEQRIAATQQAINAMGPADVYRKAMAQKQLNTLKADQMMLQGKIKNTMGGMAKDQESMWNAANDNIVALEQQRGRNMRQAQSLADYINTTNPLKRWWGGVIGAEDRGAELQRRLDSYDQQLETMNRLRHQRLIPEGVVY